MNKRATLILSLTLVGALIGLAPRPLYGDAPVTCLGLVLDPFRDQQLGGTVMLFVGGAVCLAGGLALVARALGPEAGR